jgi:hypothetical protein
MDGIRAELIQQQNGHHAHALAAMVRAIILKENFWHHCQNYVHMVEDVLKALRVFDGFEPAMGRAWLTMNNLKKHIFNLQNPLLNSGTYCCEVGRQLYKEIGYDANGSPLRGCVVESILEECSGNIRER